jgi:hypothetical protein
MPPIKLKHGSYRVRSKGRDYWYAWRGGPRLHNQPGTPAFLQELADAAATRHAPDTSKMSGLIAQYRASSYFLEDLQPSTRALWSPWLDRIRDHFGALSIRQFDRPSIKPEITRWHRSRRGTPRAADRRWIWVVVVEADPGCWLRDKGLRFHDFRGTAATRLYLAHLTLREIAEILGWSEERVEKIIDRYVKRDEILKDRIRRLEEHAAASNGGSTSPRAGPI